MELQHFNSLSFLPLPLSLSLSLSPSLPPSLSLSSLSLSPLTCQIFLNSLSGSLFCSADIILLFFCFLLVSMRNSVPAKPGILMSLPLLSGRVVLAPWSSRSLYRAVYPYLYLLNTNGEIFDARYKNYI